jgi:hypothetical protein
MKEVPSSSETSVLTRATRRNIPEDTILELHYLCSASAVITMVKSKGMKLLGTARLERHKILPKNLKVRNTWGM